MEQPAVRGQTEAPFRHGAERSGAGLRNFLQTAGGGSQQSLRRQIRPPRQDGDRFRRRRARPYQGSVFTYQGGHVVALVIDTGALISIGTKDHAVAWGKAKPEGGKDGSPLRLAFSKSEVEAAPVMTTQAPRPIPGGSGSSVPMIREDSTGNISGSRVPA